MTHSYWAALVLLPPVLLFLLLTGYDKFILGIEIKSEQRALKDYSAAEIIHAFFVAIILIASYLGGLSLLDLFEPVDRFFCYAFLLLLSLPFIGVTLAYYYEEHYKKGLGFQITIFSLSLFPTLIILAGIAYNGFADQNTAQAVRVKIVEKRIQINKGGGTPLVKLESIDKRTSLLMEPREKKVNRELYDSICIGDEMRLYIKPGTLGVPWLEKVTSVKSCP